MSIKRASEQQASTTDAARSACVSSDSFHGVRSSAAEDGWGSGTVQRRQCEEGSFHAHIHTVVMQM
jgi:hypothetical protein